MPGTWAAFGKGALPRCRHGDDRGRWPRTPTGFAAVPAGPVSGALAPKPARRRPCPGPAGLCLPVALRPCVQHKLSSPPEVEHLSLSPRQEAAGPPAVCSRGHRAPSPAPWTEMRRVELASLFTPHLPVRQPGPPPCPVLGGPVGCISRSDSTHHGPPGQGSRTRCPGVSRCPRSGSSLCTEPSWALMARPSCVLATPGLTTGGAGAPADPWSESSPPRRGVLGNDKETVRCGAGGAHARAGPLQSRQGRGPPALSLFTGFESSDNATTRHEPRASETVKSDVSDKDKDNYAARLSASRPSTARFRGGLNSPTSSQELGVPGGGSR